MVPKSNILPLDFRDQIRYNVISIIVILGGAMNLKCVFLGHHYLPKQEKVAHYNGRKTEVEYLKCLNCNDEYRYAYNEYWHIDREYKMHKAAHARLKEET
jgi:hypothetical protein